PTCLAAHIIPKDFEGDAPVYLHYITEKLLPILKREKLTNRIDIFIEQTAFSEKEATQFLNRSKQMGFQITVHADQFSVGGSAVAIEMGAQSADHLEASKTKEIEQLAASDTVAVVLPGASLGLGMPFAPARKLLDAGCCLAIASDWNPGSAPMGDLLTQAAVLGAYEKLSTPEVFAGLTFRAAHALGLEDRGRIQSGMLADLIGFPCGDYRDILYRQGNLKPELVWKNGVKI
ncbi:MAG: amidohydrolase family protein, partial [Flavobacteriaceae bacterium]|nr:amidohydrolase family protein [Flavobacteriaceae bacterium]